MGQTNLLNSDLPGKLTKGSLFTVILSITYTISGGVTSDVSTSSVRTGYVALGIVGISGLASSCSVRQFFLSEDKATISIYNKGTAASSGTCNVRVLYRAE